MAFGGNHPQNRKKHENLLPVFYRVFAFGRYDEISVYAVRNLFLYPNRQDGFLPVFFARRPDYPKPGAFISKAGLQPIPAFFVHGRNHFGSVIRVLFYTNSINIAAFRRI
jgi:hypothetical protein